MWSSEVTNMIITGIWETLYMTLVSTLVAEGLPHLDVSRCLGRVGDCIHFLFLLRQS